MGGGLESRCVGRVCGADGAVRLIITFESVVRLRTDDYIIGRLHPLRDIVAVAVLKKTIKDTPCIKGFYYYKVIINEHHVTKNIIDF